MQPRFNIVPPTKRTPQLSIIPLPPASQRNQLPMPWRNAAASNRGVMVAVPGDVLRAVASTPWAAAHSDAQVWNAAARSWLATRHGCAEPPTCA